MLHEITFEIEWQNTSSDLKKIYFKVYNEQYIIIKCSLFSHI